MSKYKDANLILKLYDLRREKVMRDARNWWFTFNPTSLQDFTDVLISEQSAYLRMVISYWEMAGSLVNNGAIDEKMFNEANGEHIFIFSKVQPFLEDLRKLWNQPDFLEQFEKLVMRTPDVEKRLVAIRERMKEVAKMREQRAKSQTAS